MSDRLLLVEDEPALQQTIKAYLEPTYRVSAVSTVAEGTLLIQEVDFDIALIDLGLPDQSGFTLIKRITTNHKKVTVLAVTGDRSEESVNEAVNLGVDGYIIKPVTHEVLHDRIKKAVLRHSSNT